MCQIDYWRIFTIRIIDSAAWWSFLFETSSANYCPAVIWIPSHFSAVNSSRENEREREKKVLNNKANEQVLQTSTYREKTSTTTTSTTTTT